MPQSAILVARKASCYVANAFFYEIKANLVNIQPENLKMFKKCVKTRPNDRNMSTKHIATLLGATCWVRLASVLRCVATCWVLLAQNLKMAKFEPTTPNTSQHVATGWPTARNMLCPTMLRWHVTIVWLGLY